jgi:dienelactone hydrolase
MITKTIEYFCDASIHKGYLAYPEQEGIRPAILVAHAWKGQDDFARDKVKALAKLGYIGFAADIYGNGTFVSTNEEAASLMTPLFINRKLLRSRITAVYKTLLQQPNVDKERIGAIGFCFGGLTVLELSRSGEKLRGIVSFHGLLGDTIGDAKADIIIPASKRYGAVLIFHGDKDPLVSSSDISNTQRELSEAKLDWQMHIYGDAVHAFTNPQANEIENGMLYNSIAERRSWQSMKLFFEEVFT